MDRAKLGRIFSKYPGIQAVYLFGTHAEGRARHDSDIDLAIVPQDHSVRRCRLDLLTDLASNGFDNVDLAFLDTDDVVLKHQAVRLNQVIYQTSEFDRGEMYSRVIRDYLDFQPALAIHREAYRRRILHAEA